MIEYETPRLVKIHNRKVGLVRRCIQIGIVLYVVLYALWLQKGYQVRVMGWVLVPMVHQRVPRPMGPLRVMVYVCSLPATHPPLAIKQRKGQMQFCNQNASMYTVASSNF